jgi:gliding motility-associated-like protein
MKQCLSFLFFLFAIAKALAQAPVINSIAPLNAAPQQMVVITGSGFSATPAQLSVWFDHVKGTVIASTPFSIHVQVPPQARFSNVEVLNLTNNLSGRSPLKFLPSFGGTSFDETKVSTPFTNADPTEMFDIASSDLDLDGKPDLVATKTVGTSSGVPATDMVIYQNTSSAIGTISFAKKDKTNFPVLDVLAPTANVSCGDLNGDGKPEIVATRTGATRNEVFILRNTNTVPGTLSFATVQKVLLDIGQFAFRVFIRDLNGDGKPELIVSNSFDDLNASTDSQMYIFPNQSTGGTIAFASPIKLSVTGASTTYGLDVQDLDGDGRADIVLNQFQTSDLFIFKNQSTGNLAFAPVQKIAAVGAFNNVTSSDLNKDGLLDLLVTATADNNIQLFINNSTIGNISFLAPQVLPTSAGPWGVDVSDMDGDGDADIVVANRNEAKVNVFRQGVPLSFTPLNIPTAKPCRNLRVGDYDGDGKPDIAVTSFAATFSVDVIRNANCVSPVIESPSTTICTGGSGQIIRLHTKPALGVTFDWKKNGTSFQASALEYADVTTPGTYTVTATAEGGTCAIVSPAFVLISDTSTVPLDPTIGNNTACLGSTLNLSTPTVASATYQWTGPNNFSSALQNPTISPLTTSNAGIYSLQIKVGVCSSNIVTKQVDVASVPVLPITASPSSATACAGSTVTLSVSTGYAYQWLKNGATIGGQTATSLATTQDGDYSVVVTSSLPVCSQETAKTTVKLLTAPVANFTFSVPTCKGTLITFTDQSIADARGTLVYTWNLDGTTSLVKTPTNTNTYTNAGPFNPSLTVSYSGVAGCSSSISKPITINAPVVPAIVAGANPICPGEATTLSIVGSYSSIAWVGVTGSTASVGITQPGAYSVNTTDTNGCSASGSITVATKPSFTLTVSADTTIKAGDQVQLKSSGADSYSWSPGKTLSDSTIANPIAKPTATTTYTVTAKKSGFCSEVKTVTVAIVSGGDKLINPPVLFTPNGDPFNDSWKIPEIELIPLGSECTMTIYDGHGSEVFQQKGYNNVNSWNGTYNGKAAPDGTYFYVFTCPNLPPATGSVLVVR